MMPADDTTGIFDALHRQQQKRLADEAEAIKAASTTPSESPHSVIRGIGKITGTSGSYGYNLTQQFWNGDTSVWDDAPDPPGLVSLYVEDFRRRRPSWPATQTIRVPFWGQRQRNGEMKYYIDLEPRYGTFLSPIYSEPSSPENTEEAQTDSWDQDSQGGNDGVALNIMMRGVYVDTGWPYPPFNNLYGFYRNFHFDYYGKLRGIKRWPGLDPPYEIRYSIDYLAGTGHIAME